MSIQSDARVKLVTTQAVYPPGAGAIGGAAAAAAPSKR